MDVLGEDIQEMAQEMANLGASLDAAMFREIMQKIRVTREATCVQMAEAARHRAEIQKEVVAVAAHIKALLEHFGWVGAGGAAAASPNPESDQDSDQNQEVLSGEIMEHASKSEAIRVIRGEICAKIAEWHRGAVEREAQATRHRAESKNEIIKHIRKESKAVVDKIGKIIGVIRTTAERVRVVEELVNAQQQQMSRMSQSMAILEAKMSWG